MSAQHDLTNTLRFSCPACSADLAVPVQMAGVEGPCPSCHRTIRAPLTMPVFLSPKTVAPAPVPEAVLSRPAWQDSGRPILSPANRTQAQVPRATENDKEWQIESCPVFPPEPGPEIKPLPPPGRTNRVILQGALPVAKDSNFKARLGIPPLAEPFDDSWKDRHRSQHRSNRRTQRMEKAAHEFLESRGFRVARLALILLSGAMLAFLFHFLQNHQWRFPGLTPVPVAEQKPGSDQGRVRPVGTDANELMADDDAEIPPAAGTIPGTPGSGARPIAGTPR